MRYKNNVLEKLTQLEALSSSMNVIVNRGGTQEQANQKLEEINAAIEKIREIISLEHDEFAQQFNGL